MAGGLYNVLFGTHPTAMMVAEALRMRPIPAAYRDAWYDADAEELVVYARLDALGLGFEVGSRGELGLMCLRGFLRWRQDDFDPSYVFFHYGVPEDLRTEFGMLREAGYGVPVDPARRWRELLEGIERHDMSNPAVRRAFLLRCYARRKERRSCRA